jgi:hypothetical protein
VSAQRPLQNRRSGTHRERSLPSGGEELLPKDVGMPAVLSQFTEYVKQYPAQRERASAIPDDHSVEVEIGDRLTRLLTSGPER